MTYIDNDQNGIVKVLQNGIEYTVWTHANVVRPHVKKFLKEKFPDSLVVSELNRIDFVLPEKNLPVEIQSTIVGHSNSRYAGIHYATWENNIRTQIDRNIVPYGVCWFFFDSELLTCMKNATRGMDISMDWFRQYMKEEKLKVFTVSYEGVVEEKIYKDFDFLSSVSQTCKIAAETDDMMLNKNKMKIFTNVINGHGFTQDEIDKFEDGYKKYCKTNKIDVDKIGDNKENDRMRVFLLKLKDERAKLYAYILYAVNNLPAINQLLDRKAQSLKKRQIDNAKVYARTLGIFDTEGYTQRCITRFIDRFDVCKYFQGFLRNEEIWSKLRSHGLNNRQFGNIIENANNGITINDYFWYEKSDDDNSKLNNHDRVDKDKEVNIEIKSEDKVTIINIRKNETAGW